MIEDYIRKPSSRFLTGEDAIVLKNRVPSYDELRRKFREIDEVGIYLHIPFCDQICPYCPYNKELYQPDIARKYAVAVKNEINLYADIVGNRTVTSLYIGGGTPTTMLKSGLEEILAHLYDTFNMHCDIHMESHPDHLSSDNLDTLVALGVKYLSIFALYIGPIVPPQK